MNIITKIKNWLIKKLGGYTVDDYTDVCCQRNVWKKLHDMGENHLRIAETGIDYWYDNYTAEHNAYLALLNCHNATADYANSISYAADTDYIHKTDVAAMAKALKAYCADHPTCEGCDLADESGLCKTLMNISPCYWEVE